MANIFQIDRQFQCILVNLNLPILIQISPKSVCNDPIELSYTQWLSVEEATSNYRNQWLLSLLTHICVTRPEWVNGGVNCSKLQDMLLLIHRLHLVYATGHLCILQCVIQSITTAVFESVVSVWTMSLGLPAASNLMLTYVDAVQDVYGQKGCPAKIIDESGMD